MECRDVLRGFMNCYRKIKIHTAKNEKLTK